MSSESLSIIERPQIGRPTMWSFPAHTEWRLDNDLRVWAFNLPGQAVISADLIMELPLGLEPSGLEGVASLATDTADEGTIRHPGEAFSEAMESGGVHYSSRAAFQTTRLGVDVVADRMGAALGLLAEALQEPTYDPRDVSRHIDDEFTRLADLESNPSAKTMTAAAAALYPADWRESRRASGSQETLARIDAQSLHSFRDRHWSPSVATLIVAGHLPDGLPDLIERSFGDWEKTDVPTLPAPPPIQADQRHVWVVDHPGAVQAIVSVSCLTPTRGHCDLEALQMGAMAMGGSFLSRLNKTLREDRGYTYGASCAVSPQRHTGSFSAHTRCRNDVIGPLLTELFALLDVSKHPFTATEVDAAIDYAIGVAPLAYDTADAIAMQAGGFVAAGMTPEWFAIHQAAYLGVTPEAATEAFTRWVNPDRVNVVIGGDATKLVPALSAIGLEPTVVDAFGKPLV